MASRIRVHDRSRAPMFTVRLDLLCVIGAVHPVIPVSAPAVPSSSSEESPPGGQAATPTIPYRGSESRRRHHPVPRPRVLISLRLALDPHRVRLRQLRQPSPPGSSYADAPTGSAPSVALLPGEDGPAGALVGPPFPGAPAALGLRGPGSPAKGGPPADPPPPP